MHGVTGRMGTNQHLIRSIAAIRQQAACRSPTAVVIQPDPILVGRNADKIEALAKATASSAGAPISTPRSPIPTTRFSSMPARRRCARPARAGDQGRQAHLLREADRDEPSPRRWRSARSRKRAGLKNGVGAGQAVPARPAEAARCCAIPASSAACSRCAASSAIGCSRATGQPAQRPSWNYRARGRRRHHPRHGLPLALRARQSVRRGEERCRCLGATHIPERWDEDGKPYEATADDAAYATFSSKAA